MSKVRKIWATFKRADKSTSDCLNTLTSEICTLINK